MTHQHLGIGPSRLLWMIETRIDQLAGTQAWLGLYRNSHVMCTMPDGRQLPVEQISPPPGFATQ